jgi:hypothetical protein
VQTTGNAAEKPAASLQFIDDDVIHILEVQEDAPNLADGLKSKPPIEAPNTGITILPKRGPL